MPLYAIDGKSNMMNGFDHIVIGAAAVDDKPFATSQDTLMMGAVMEEAVSEEATEPASFLCMAGMDLVCFVTFPGMAEGSRKMLDHGPAEVDIDDLMTTADTQDRLLCPGKGIQHGKLQVIQRVKDHKASVQLLAVAGGIDIASARDQQAVIVFYMKFGIVKVFLMNSQLQLFHLHRNHDGIHSRREKSSCVVGHILIDFRYCDPGTLHSLVLSLSFFYSIPYPAVKKKTKLSARTDKLSCFQ